jgi:soluble lytic murein transglycosylase-like protein
MNKLKFVTVSCIALVVVLGILRIQRNQQPMQEIVTKRIKTTDPPCLQMYFYIEKYAEEYNIPRSYAYGIAYCETRYNGPFHWNYKPSQTSSVGAVGPMQIMLPTANYINKNKTTKDELKNNIELNVKTSMKLLRHLKDTYHDWKLVFGCYNTGRPMVNDYAIRVYNFNPSW